MADKLTCSECGTEAETPDDMERKEVPEIETDEDENITLHSNKDLFLCSGCKEPMGVGRHQSDE